MFWVLWSELDCSYIMNILSGMFMQKQGTIYIVCYMECLKSLRACLQFYSGALKEGLDHKARYKSGDKNRLVSHYKPNQVHSKLQCSKV